MKANTVYWLGIKHVGDSTHKPIVKEMALKEMMHEILRFCATTSMKTRFEFVIARRRSEIDARFANSKTYQADSFEDMDAVWAELEAQEN